MLADVIEYMEHVRAVCYSAVSVEFVREKWPFRDGGKHMAWAVYSKRAIRYESTCLQPEACEYKAAVEQKQPVKHL